MPRLTIDTTEAMSRELVEPGPYPLVVETVGDPAQGDKSTYVPIMFKFQDPEIARHCGNIFRNYPISGKGAGFFRELWKAATGEDLPMDAQIDVDTDDLIGRVVLGQVFTGTWEGKNRNEVGTVTSA